MQHLTNALNGLTDELKRHHHHEGSLNGTHEADEYHEDYSIYDDHDDYDDCHDDGGCDDN